MKKMGELLSPSLLLCLGLHLASSGNDYDDFDYEFDQSAHYILL